MAGTLTIPLTTLPVGVREFGPASAADADTAILLAIDRTVPGGLNSLTPATTITVEAQASTDGGVTWHAVDTDQAGTVTSWSAEGGPAFWTDQAGGTHVHTESSGRWPLFPGTGRRAKARITVAGSAVAVAGTLTTS